MIHKKPQKKGARVQGFTIIELILASTISLLIGIFVAFLFLFTMRVHAVLLPQMGHQQESSRAMQVMSDLLRNSIYESITIPSSNVITYESSELPAAQTAKIEFTNGNLSYFSKATDTKPTRVLAENLENVSFSFDGQMIGVHVIFKYRKFRGHNQSEEERLNGTFETQIYPRNKELI